MNVGVISQQAEKWIQESCRIVRENFRRFAAILAVALIAHYQMIANGLQNPDSIWLGDDYHIAGAWELSLGRWGLVWIDYLRGGFISPVLSGVSMLVLYTLAGMLLVCVLGMQNSRLLRWLIPLTVVLTPQVLITESYLFCSISYALAFLLAVASVWCLQQLTSWRGVLAGALCLLFAASLYQSNVDVTAGLLAMWLLTMLLSDPGELAAFGRQLVRAAVTFAAGIGLYYLVLQVILRLQQTSMAEYKGAGSIGLLYSLRKIGTTLPNAYRDFFQYFFGRDIAANYYGVRPIYAALFVIALAVLAVRLWHNRAHRLACGIACLLIVLLPVAVGIIDLIAPDTTLILLTCSGLLTVVPFALSLCVRYAPPVQRGAVCAVAGALCLVLLRGYVLQVNTDSTTLLASQRTTTTVAHCILQDLQQIPAFRQGMPVTVQGQPENGNYPNLSPCRDKADQLIRMGLLFHSAHANSAGWQHIFKQYLGVAPNWCTEAQVLSIVDTAEYQLMPVYPEEGSIGEIDGCLVVKVAP